MGANEGPGHVTQTVLSSFSSHCRGYPGPGRNASHCLKKTGHLVREAAAWAEAKGCLGLCP